MAKSNNLADLIKADAKAFRIEKRVISELVGNEAVNFFQDNFKRQGFLDGSLKAWKPRKGEKKRTKGTKKKDKEGRNILVSTGQLRSSIKKVVTSKKKIVIRSEMATPFNYSGVHNYGLRAGRGAGFKMPQRKFIGKSKTLDRDIIKLINLRLRKAFNK